MIMVTYLAREILQNVWSFGTIFFASPQALAPPYPQDGYDCAARRLRIAFELTNPIQEEQQITTNSKR